MNYMDELYGGVMVMAIVFLVSRMFVLMLLNILIIWLVGVSGGLRSSGEISAPTRSLRLA